MSNKKENKPPTINEALLNAFENSFYPADADTATCVMDYANIREYFGLYFNDKHPDLLPLYIEALKERGFALTLSFDGAPCLFLTRQITGLRCCPSLEDEQSIEQS